MRQQGSNPCACYQRSALRRAATLHKRAREGSSPSTATKKKVTGTCSLGVDEPYKLVWAVRSRTGAPYTYSHMIYALSAYWPVAGGRLINVCVGGSTPRQRTRDPLGRVRARQARFAEFESQVTHEDRANVNPFDTKRGVVLVALRVLIRLSGEFDSLHLD